MARGEEMTRYPCSYCGGYEGASFMGDYHIVTLMHFEMPLKNGGKWVRDVCPKCFDRVFSLGITPAPSERDDMIIPPMQEKP